MWALTVPALAQSSILNPNVRKTFLLPPDIIVGSSLWTLVDSDPNVVFSNSNGQLVNTITSLAGTNGSELATVPTFNFTNKEVSIDIVQWDVLFNTGASTSQGFYLRVYDPAVPTRSMLLGKEQFQINYTANNQGVVETGAASGSIPNTLNKLRIKHRASDNRWLFYLWNTSAVPFWDLRFTSAVQSWSPTNMKISLTSYEYHGLPGTQPTIVDNLISDVRY